jgi:hypothetical protein
MRFLGIGARWQRPPDSQLEGAATTAPDWEAATFSLEVQLRHIDRATITAQSFLGALTLSAALAGPLLVIGARRSLLYGIFGLLLIAYLAVLGNAIRHCMRATYRRIVKSESFNNPLHYIHIASKFASGAAYSEHARRRDHEDRIRDVYEYVWLTATVMADRRKEIHRAIRWTIASFLLLGFLVVFRFIIALVLEPTPPV